MSMKHEREEDNDDLFEFRKVNKPASKQNPTTTSF